MKKQRYAAMILIGFLICGIIVWGSLRAFASNPSFLFAVSSNPTSPSPEIAHAIVESKSKPLPVFNFNSVNGISLYDTKESITTVLGQPEAIVKDPDLIELETYVYPLMKVGFSYGTADYVEVPVESGSILIDNIRIATTVKAMEAALGEPEFIAEDGIVFQRKDAFIKLFFATETQQPTLIHYFHKSST